LFGKWKNLIYTDFHHTWALANYFGTDDDDNKTLESRQVENEEEQENEEAQQIIEDQEGEVDRETATNLSDSILSVNEPIRKRKKLCQLGLLLNLCCYHTPPQNTSWPIQK
jgi:hypothetical protein